LKNLEWIFNTDSIEPHHTLHIPTLYFLSYSFYNFRVRHGSGDTMAPPDKLIGECVEEAQGVCTDRANFHKSLAIFGKTNMTNPSERNLLRMLDKYKWVTPIDNPVFLYDVAQLYDTNEARKALFKQDLQNFLGLDAPLPEFDDNTTSSMPKFKAMNICDSKYDSIRKELITIGTRASMWIRKYFLKSDQVYVSSQDFFENVLKDWKNDPCASKNATSGG